MQCRMCAELLPPRANFCGACGTSAIADVGNRVDTGGGDIQGGLYQAGRDVVINPEQDVPKPATYSPVPVWRSPFTLGVLSWIGLIVGLIGLLPLWSAVQELSGVVQTMFARTIDVGAIASSPNQIAVPLLVTAAVAIVLIGVLELRRVTKLQLRKPLVFGWALSGVGGRLTFEKIKADKCPRCGGAMRYRNKATRWMDHRYANGRTRREVTERVPALECARNADHWFTVDPAEHPM